MSSVLVAELEQIVPDLINMLVALDAPELATVAVLVEKLGVALADELANGEKIGAAQAVQAADTAALVALRLRFKK